MRAVPFIALAVGIVYLALPPAPWSELLLYDGAVVLMTCLSVWGWRHSAAGDRRFNFFIALWSGSFLAAELIWWGLTHQGLDPFPSAADGFFLLGYLALAGAVATSSAAARRERDRSAWLDAPILTAVSMIVLWQLMIEPTIDQSMSTFAMVVTVAYPIADLIVLGHVLALLLSGAARGRRATLLTAGTLCMLAGDAANAQPGLNESFVVGRLMDAGWILAYVLIGAAAVAPGRPPVSRASVDIGVTKLVLTLVAVVIPQAVIALEITHRLAFGFDRLTIAMAAATVILVLVVVRLWWLMGRTRALEQRRGENRLAMLIHRSADAIVLIDRDYRIAFASPAVEDLAGLTPEASLGTGMTSWFPDDPDGLTRRLDDLVSMPTGSVIALSERLVSVDQAERFVEGTACNLLDDPDIQAVVVTMRDVTARRELESQLEWRAFHDDLTGLANRALFADRVTHSLERIRRAPSAGIALLFLDLDDFKAVNDGMGHAVGDQLLMQVAARLSSCLRPADTIARLGGDEFAILLDDIGAPEHARDLAERVVEVLRMPMEVADVHLGVRASVGVAIGLDDSTDESLMRDADIAMYCAKAEGKGCVVVFDDTMRELAAARLAGKVESLR
jgi:diguanylate cyclase (GGDEF)-like protein/PAS domain S-box-containing protein